MTISNKPDSIQGGMTNQSKIYTRKGDGGETSLGDNQRVKKSNPRVEALGTLDELNSAIGLAHAMLPPKSSVRSFLPEIQQLLLTIGSNIALPPEADAKYRARVPKFPEGKIEILEQTIDTWWAQLPPLSTFILPGGTPAASALHLARAAARRAERRIVDLPADLDPNLKKWLNRLSDFLFAAARIANFEQGVPDITWQKQT